MALEVPFGSKGYSCIWKALDELFEQQSEDPLNRMIHSWLFTSFT